MGRPASADYLRSGLVHCGLCGRGLTGRPQYGRTYPDGEIRRRYWCQKRQTGGGCHRISINARTLDREVGALVIATLSDPRHPRIYHGPKRAPHPNNNESANLAAEQLAHSHRMA